MGSEWTQTDLGDVLSFSNGQSSPDRTSGGLNPVFGSNGLIGFSDQTNAGSSTIIIGRVGSYCGSLQFSKDPCWVTDNAIRATAKGDNAPRFLFYLLERINLHQWRGGSGQPLLNQRTLNAISTKVPDPEEQHTIADILGTLDDKIELNRQMNRTLETMARAIFKAWFVDFEPVKAKAAGAKSFRGMPQSVFDQLPDRFTDTELGPIPEGWEVGELGQVMEHPRRTKRPAELHEATPYIGLEHMPQKSIALSEWGQVGSVSSNKHQFHRGELLFGKLRPYFHKVGIAPVDGVCSTDVVVIRPKRDGWFGYVLGHISSGNFVSYTTAASTGTKMPRTNWNDMRRYKVVLPNSGIAFSYSEFISPLMGSVAAGIHESRTLASLRDTLLPKLISGELRVRSSELPAAEVACR